MYARKVACHWYTMRCIGESLRGCFAGSHLAFSSHKSQVAFLSDLDAAQPQSWSSASCQRLKLDFLPQRAVKFLAEDLVATGGFDGEALLLGRSAAGQWAFLRKASGTTSHASYTHQLPIGQVVNHVLEESSASQLHRVAVCMYTAH